MVQPSFELVKNAIHLLNWHLAGADNDWWCKVVVSAEGWEKSKVKSEYKKKQIERLSAEWMHPTETEWNKIYFCLKQIDWTALRQQSNLFYSVSRKKRNIRRRELCQLNLHNLLMVTRIVLFFPLPILTDTPFLSGYLFFWVVYYTVLNIANTPLGESAWVVYDTQEVSLETINYSKTYLFCSMLWWWWWWRWFPLPSKRRFPLAQVHIFMALWSS